MRRQKCNLSTTVLTLSLEESVNLSPTVLILALEESVNLSPTVLILTLAESQMTPCHLLAAALTYTYVALYNKKSYAKKRPPCHPLAAALTYAYFASCTSMVTLANDPLPPSSCGFDIHLCYPV
ncbi:hypothetical protein J6590_076259 [Homalodisca vitripennis]|nr:hypothetical protein J6590_076259 [Homalodisca vitripennis]